MKEILDLLIKYEEKYEMDFPSIKLFSDGSGEVYNDEDREIFVFGTIKALEKFLKEN